MSWSEKFPAGGSLLNLLSRKVVVLPSFLRNHNEDSTAVSFGSPVMPDILIAARQQLTALVHCRMGLGMQGKL
jgi:hypothetical protein